MSRREEPDRARFELPIKKKNIFSLGLLFLYLIKYKTGLATQIFVLIKNVHSNKK